MALPERTKIQLLAPVVRGRKGTHAKLLFDRAKKSGYVRVRVDGNLYELSEEITLDKNIKHNIEIIVDRLVVKPGIEKEADRFCGKCTSAGRGTASCRCDRWRANEFQPEFFLS